MSTRVDYESSNPLLEFFENEDQEEEARARKRYRRVAGPPNRGRRFNFANRNRQFLKPRRFPRRFIRPFPRPFPRPVFGFPRPFPFPSPGWGTVPQPGGPPVNQVPTPGSGSSGYAAPPMDDAWGPEGASIEGPSQEPPEGNGQSPSVDDAEPIAGSDAQPGGDEELFEFFNETEFGDPEFGVTPEYESWQTQLNRGRSGRRRRCNCHQNQTGSRARRFSGYGMRPQFAWQGETEGNFEYETNPSVFPQSVITMVKRGLINAGLKLAIGLGFRSESQLTNLVFFMRHPERGGRPIAAGEPNYSGLVREWIAIRDQAVRPALLGGSSAGRSYTPQAPSFPYQSTTVTPTPSSGTPDIVKVRGINVARQIAPQVEGLLAAAEAAGIRLSGGGYRSREAQIELRKKHCGTTQYDIFEKPSSQCTPPTAPPGRSQHEKGLAIDFTYGGSTIKSQSSPGFQWLKANAARFGLYNLPSEPWHWSVDGR